MVCGFILLFLFLSEDGTIYDCVQSWQEGETHFLLVKETEDNMPTLCMVSIPNMATLLILNMTFILLTI